MFVCVVAQYLFVCLSGWHKLRSFQKVKPQLTKMPPLDWPVNKSMGAFFFFLLNDCEH